MLEVLECNTGLHRFLNVNLKYGLPKNTQTSWVRTNSAVHGGTELLRNMGNYLPVGTQPYPTLCHWIFIHFQWNNVKSFTLTAYTCVQHTHTTHTHTLTHQTHTHTHTHSHTHIHHTHTHTHTQTHTQTHTHTLTLTHKNTNTHTHTHTRQSQTATPLNYIFPWLPQLQTCFDVQMKEMIRFYMFHIPWIN
jgi:hypothetical protein